MIGAAEEAPRWFQGRSRDCDECAGEGCRTCGGLGFIPGERIGWAEDYEAARRDAAEAEQ